MSLPEEYRGYSTKALIKIWEAIPSGQAEGIPPEKMVAMRRLLREFKLSPLTWKTEEDKKKAEALLAELERLE